MGLTANVRGKRREFLIGLIAPQGGRKQEMPLQTHTHTYMESAQGERADRQAGRLVETGWEGRKGARRRPTLVVQS